MTKTKPEPKLFTFIEFNEYGNPVITFDTYEPDSDDYFHDLILKHGLPQILIVKHPNSGKINSIHIVS